LPTVMRAILIMFLNTPYSFSVYHSEISGKLRRRSVSPVGAVSMTTTS